MYIIYSVYSIVHSVWNNIYTLLQTFLENFSNKKLYKEWKPQRKWQKHCKILCIYVFSVSDPYHFDLDPDPGICICDDGSGSGSEVTFDSVNWIFPIKCYARL